MTLDQLTAESQALRQGAEEILAFARKQKADAETIIAEVNKLMALQHKHDANLERYRELVDRLTSDPADYWKQGGDDS